MMSLLRGLLAAGALACCAAADASGPAGGNYAITSSVMASGTGGISGGAFAIASSLGDLSRAPALAGGARQLFPGFWSGAGLIVLPGCLLDIDGNGVLDALTDGLLILRAMFGLTGASVMVGAIGANAQRTTWDQIQPVLDFAKLDIDGNGAAEALTDGLLIMRAMFGLTGSAVTAGAVGAGAQRTDWTMVRGYLNNSCGASFAQ